MSKPNVTAFGCAAEAEFEVGDRVQSYVTGCFRGTPGRIIRKVQVQRKGRPTWEYDVRLDTGKVMRLDQNSTDFTRLYPMGSGNDEQD